MSGEGIARTPVLAGSYVMFKREVKLWVATTALPKERQAGTLVFSLPDKDKEAAMDIDVAVLKDGKTVTVDGRQVVKSGVDCLLEVLDGIYLESLSKETIKSYDEFRSLKRKSSESVRDFILRFEKSMKRLKDHNIVLPEAVLAYEVLRGSSIDDHKYSVALTLTKELTYDNMKAVIKSLTQIKEDESSSQQSVMRVVKEEENMYYTNQDGYEDDCEFDGDNWRDQCKDQNEEEVYYGGRFQSRGRSRGNFRRPYIPNGGQYYNGRGNNYRKS